MSNSAQRLICLLFLSGAGDFFAEAAKVAEPKVSSIAPLGFQRGTTASAIVRGTGLSDVTSVWFRESGITARVLRVEGQKEGNPVQLLHVEIAVTGDAKAGLAPLRVIAGNGMSNEIKIRVSDEAVLAEERVPETITQLPTLINGSVAQHGESDQFCLQATSKQRIAFEAFSGSPGFDPVVSLYEQSASWFDSKRQNFIASNDEPVDFPGMPQDSRLIHQFDHEGRYCVRVEGFSGKGSPDAQYQLRIAPFDGPEPRLRPAPAKTWDERRATRVLSKDWMAKVAARGDGSATQTMPEIYHAVPEGSPEIPTMKAPGFVEGAITHPGECHVIRLNVEKPQDLVIEIETPESVAPFFNPIVRLLEPGGNEIVTTVYTRLNNNNLKAFKAIQPKVTFDLQAPGLYTMQIRDLSTDIAQDDFKYRVLVRQQIPHVGRFAVSQEYVNLPAGATKNLTLTADREEEFKGTVAFSVENLPPGVTAITGLENPDERPALPNAGKMERYRPKPQIASIVLSSRSRRAGNYDSRDDPHRVSIGSRRQDWGIDCRDRNSIDSGSEAFFMKHVFGLVAIYAVALQAADPQVTTLRIEPASRVLRGSGATQQFLAIGKFSDGTERDLTETATWAASSPESSGSRD